jgi:hypothetical protein
MWISDLAETSGNRLLEFIPRLADDIGPVLMAIGDSQEFRRGNE